MVYLIAFALHTVDSYPACPHVASYRASTLPTGPVSQPRWSSNGLVWPPVRLGLRWSDHVAVRMEASRHFLILAVDV